MKIKRFVAPDMRQAMRQVRDEQGPDAVILSTRRLDDGIEIIAALDYDEALVREAGFGVDLPPREREEAPIRARRDNDFAARIDQAKAATAAAVERVTRGAPAPAAPQVANPNAPQRQSSAALAASVADVVRAATVAPNHNANSDAAVNGVRAEINSLREMLEVQLSTLAWNQMDRDQPLRARVLREMTRLGIDGDVARALCAELPPGMTAEQARYLPLGILSRNIRTSGRNADTAGSAVTALVGTTGVGKTTTIAKLAARAVLRHGASNVALISADQYRIGAGAQLEHYGRLLGVRVYNAHDAQSLRNVLLQLRGKHTVLIDTAGLAGNDPKLQQQFDTLRAMTEVRVCLVLAANAQAQAIDNAIRAYAPLAPQTAILTKLDEAPLIGGALSAVIRHGLPLDYTTDGQRVPEDIASADARKLVCLAAQLVKQRTDEPDDAILADRFGFSTAPAIA
ncbi:MAG: flagellar biosynthesis protein FlhF [Luteibacter sp.]|uniref:flagellar biosynthesis protein FlhF n=1 Tax=unclassified Luteibacter TaxID=2620188 RepID=UPI0005B82AFC|nr:MULTISPECIES: flagellar biosynthesis protein FlhF [unclassified Luteibacter]MDQ7997033.1 flagellar biosynthesis protein FlhF [Luteibacter sp.]MDR6643257.1 flagellar biosynthesis protein FlhF [Luteibacter sp. 1214]